MRRFRKFILSALLASGLILILYQALVSSEGLPKHGGSTDEVVATTNLSNEMEQLLNKRIETGKWIKAKVQSSRDGDTVVLSDFEATRNTKKSKKFVSELNRTGSVPFRLLAIDTPESTKVIQPWGKEASNFTKSLVNNKNVYIEIDEAATYDHYGRLLGHLFTEEGNSVQKLLLERGYARVAYLFEDYKYVEDYKDAEAIAKENNLNIHSIPGYVTDKGFDMTVAQTKVNSEELEDASYNDVLQVFEVIEGLTE